jgi:isopentenyldiphosphate isomerase
MDYYKKRLNLAEVDRSDRIIGPVERWISHEKGICHRGFTTILVYNNQVILQQRKHPAFDGFYDLTFSSHPIYVNGKLQLMEEAVYSTLEREWNLTKKDLKTDIKYLDKFYYKAKDLKSIYTEHEVDYLYLVELDKLPNINKDFAYDYEMIGISNFNPPAGGQISNFQMAPWVIKMVANNIISPHLNFG